MQHNPIRTLIDEHDLISSAEPCIRALNGTWEQDAAAYTAKVRTLLDFFRNYIDRFHHYKEEAVLFKSISENPLFMLHDLIAELEDHHKNFRDTLKEIEACMEKQDWVGTQKLLERYMNDLLDHIGVENDEFFVMAESISSECELERMYFLFEDIDMDLGKQRKNDLAGILQSLRNKIDSGTIARS